MSDQPDRQTNMTASLQSNYLPDLAARIRIEHEAVSIALKDSVRHAITAGELLIEAKDKVGHGNWLPWLQDHCTISERTAQLYMRCAKNREEIEEQIRNGVADLSLNEAAAMLMLSSDVRKLLNLTKTMATLEGEALIAFCAENDIGVMHNPFGEIPKPTPQEMVEWAIFMLWLIREQGWPPEAASNHAEWVQSRGTLLADWMKPNRIRACLSIPQVTVAAWNAFLDANRNRTLEDVEAEIKREDDPRAEKLQAMLARKLSRKDRRLITTELARRRAAS